MLRYEQDVTQRALGLAAGIDVSYLSQLENGHRRNPSLQLVARLIAAYAELGKPLTNEQRRRLLDAATNMTSEAA